MTTSVEIFGPIYYKIKEMGHATPKRKRQIEKQLIRDVEKTMMAFRAFDEEYAAIKNSNLELEEKLKTLHGLLDEKMIALSELDMKSSLLACENNYMGYWEKLDDHSRKYLAMAYYLYELLPGTETDYSPSVVELGRAVENELIQKIYSEYVSRLCEYIDEMDDQDNNYSSLIKAVYKYNNTGTYFIPAREMVKYLCYLSECNYENAFNETLKAFLKDHNIDLEQISNKEFTDLADTVFDEYRNLAAHPGKAFDSHEAQECSEKTKEVLKTFMGAIN